MRRVEDKVLVGVVAAVSVAMAWIALPFAGAILWGIVSAIVFAPMNQWFRRRMPTHPNTSALLTLLAIILMVVVPVIAIGTLLVDEAINLYNSIETNQLDFGKIIARMQAGLPDWLRAQLTRLGMEDMSSFRDQVNSVLSSAARLMAAQALTIGQSAFGFMLGLGLMLYLTYFLLRDGGDLVKRVGEQVPLQAEQRRALFEKFATVIRATIKGSIVVAVVQGFIGGFVFWILDIHAALLWGVVMGFLSLVPAIGTGLIWVPVSIYLLATGAIWQGIVLILCGLFVIGMVDNVLRPILVGKDTRMPDYVVLISTLGGLSVLGVNGFILGPVIAALFIASWDIFSRFRKTQQRQSPDARA